MNKDYFFSDTFIQLMNKWNRFNVLFELQTELQTVTGWKF